MCRNLKDVRLPEGLEVIGMGCFSESGLKRLALPASVKSVGAAAFRGCWQLKHAQLNEGLESLGKKEVVDGVEWEGSVFGYSAVGSVALPSTLRRVEARMFEFCRNLKSIALPDGVEYIGEHCFQWSGVREIALPGTLGQVAKDAFKDCSKLETVSVDGGCAVDIERCVADLVYVRRGPRQPGH